jgi:hypothetical protein
MMLQPMIPSKPIWSKQTSNSKKDRPTETHIGWTIESFIVHIYSDFQDRIPNESIKNTRYIF